MTDPILEIRNLQKYFESGGFIEGLLGMSETIQAVEEVNLTIMENETVALIGESGCGKSTVAKAIMGIHEPTSGEVRFKGTPITSDNVGEKAIQLIPQDSGESLNPRKTVGTIIGTPLTMRGVDDVPAEVDDLLTRVGLDPNVKNRYPGAFSGGQKQRIAIARALASDPDILIADEPVSGLDVSVQAKIINLLNDLRTEMGLSLLLISHNLAVVRTISDRVNIMYLGEIVERGNVDDIFGQPAHPYTEALLSAIQLPEPRAKTERIILSGELPNSQNPPSGCRFHTRCPYAIDGVCDQSSPEFREESTNADWPIQGADHVSRCHLLDESEAADEADAAVHREPADT